MHAAVRFSSFSDGAVTLLNWPRDGYIEIAPKYWAVTRIRLDPGPMKLPIGHVSVPAPAPQQSWSNVSTIHAYHRASDCARRR